MESDMKNQNRARKNIKAKGRGSHPKWPVFHFTFADVALAALHDLQKQFPISFEGTKNSNPALMAGRILEVALANVEIIAPRIFSMIRYCEAEGIDQGAYLKSLIETKFKKKLHLVKNRRASS
jgi:hypothetical protein